MPRAAIAVCALALLVPASAGAATFANASTITINDNASASPYPSIIPVSGLPGRVSHVTVTLSNLTHGGTSDLGIVLVAPDGTAMMLMEGAGNSSAGSTFTFSDSAAAQMPETGPLASGTWKPTQVFTGDSFPAPGPGGDYCAPPRIGTCTLAGAFNGLAPNGAWQLYVRDFNPGNSGTLGGWSIDLETDAVAPETTVDSGPTGATGNSTPTFGFSAGEAGSTFQCRFDSEPFAACAAPAAHTPASALPDGSHVFEVRATDPSGNVDASPAQRAFTVDTVAPETTIGAAAVAERNVTFAFQAAEPATFTCSLDGAPAEACTSPKTYTSLADGVHSLAVVATDTAGNADATPAVKTATVSTAAAPAGATPDTRAPAVALAGLKVNAKRRTAKLTWIAVDDVTAAKALTFECKLDKAAFKQCKSPASFTKLKPGAHKLQLRAKDAAGNTSAPLTKSFKLKKPST